VGPEGKLYRVVVATHPAGKKKSPMGVNLQIYKLLTSTLVFKLYAGDCVDVGTAVPEFSDQWQVTPGFTALQTSSLMVLKAKKIPTSTKERASGIRKDGARSSLDGTITLAPTARSFRRA
jgi:hypothetical protein